MQLGQFRVVVGREGGHRRRRRSNGVLCLVHRPAKQRMAEAQVGQRRVVLVPAESQGPNLFRTGSRPARCQRRHTWTLWT